LRVGDLLFSLGSLLDLEFGLCLVHVNLLADKGEVAESSPLPDTYA
jgi:hypothetical protein